MPHALVFHVVPIYKSSTDPLEHLFQRLLPFFEQQMYMISHQAVRQQPKSADFFTLFQYLEELLIILRILKDLLPVDASQHDMIYSAFRALSCLSRHLNHPILGYHISLHLSTHRTVPCVGMRTPVLRFPNFTFDDLFADCVALSAAFDYV